MCTAHKILCALAAAALCLIWTGSSLAQVPAAGGAAGWTKEEAFARKVSIDLRDMDIVDVLKFLSLKGDFNIVVDKGISGRVTLVLKDVSIGDALDIVLKANSLAYQQVKNIVYVMTSEQYLNTYGVRFDDTTEVRIINLKYAKPSYVLATLDNLKSNIGKIVIDEDTGSLVLIDTPQNLSRMIHALEGLDKATKTIVYQLQYAAAEDIAAQLKTKLDAKSVGSIQADVRSNQLIVTALPERLEEAERLIKELDKATKAVMIEIRFLKLAMNPKYDFGIDWSQPFSGNETAGIEALELKQSFPFTTNLGGAVSSFSYGLINPAQFHIRLQAMKQVADSKLVANPRVTVVNNEEASIHIGDTIPYVTSTTTGTGDTATVSEEINFIDVGIKITVTPTINDEGMVTMKIRPEISSTTVTVATPQGANIPQVNTTFVETTAVVKDGHTVIIGGLRQIQSDVTMKGLPPLARIPLIGRLFRTDSESLNDQEIVILLTPHVISGKVDVTDQRQQARQNHNYSGFNIRSNK